MSHSEPVSADELLSLLDSAETHEELLLIEEQLLAIESAARSTAQQKATLQRLTQQASAWLIGVSTKHLRDQGAARNLDSTYNGPDLVQWIIDREITKAKEQWERTSDTLKTAEERQAEAKAIKYEAEAKGVQDRYIEREDVYQEFQQLVSSVRSELEGLPKSMANDFPQEIRDSLVMELRNQIKQILRRLAAHGGRYEPPSTASNEDR